MHTARGLVAIEEVEIGDWVWSRNDETGEEDWKRVAHLFITPDQPVWKLLLETADGRIQELVATSGHPLRTDDEEWTPLGNLVLGDVVWAEDGRKVAEANLWFVESTEKRAEVSASSWDLVL